MNEMRKYVQLIESANNDLKVLGEIADVIIDHLPPTLRGNETVLRAGYINYKSYYGLINAFEDYKPLIYQAMKNTNYHFINDETKNDVGGEIIIHDNRQPNDLIINFSGFIEKSSNDYATKDLFSVRNNTMPARTLKTLLIHELRHLWQETKYGGYFGKNQQYDTTPDEIDAAWVHIIYDYSTDSYNNVNEFSNAVMDKLSTYKKLTHKQKKHYERKTQRYWYEQHNGVSNTEKEDLSDRLEKYKESKRQNVIADINEAGNKSVFHNLLNFEEYQNYKLTDDFSKNMLAKDAIFSLLVHAVNNRLKTEDVEMLSYTMGFFALVNLKRPLDIEHITYLFSKYYDMDKNKAIKHIKDNGFISEYYNKDFFIKIIDDTFE